MDFVISLGTRKVLDARRRGAMTEVYEQYAADDSLMVDQGYWISWQECVS